MNKTLETIKTQINKFNNPINPIKMDLPKKDKDGNSYLSYSQISLFRKNKKEYHERYILNKPFIGNAYTDFGSKVGEALENNDFTNFEDGEQCVLKKVTRLDEFERKVHLDYDAGFYVVGYIDTNKKNFSEIIDYKTGGRNKEFQYSESEYTQLCIYALSIRQETGVTPRKATVEFIRRDGNAFRGEKLSIAKENPLKIDVDISMERLKIVYWEILETAKEIEKYYLDYNSQLLEQIENSNRELPSNK